MGWVTNEGLCGGLGEQACGIRIGGKGVWCRGPDRKGKMPSGKGGAWSSSLRMRFGQTDPELNRNNRETGGISASLLYLWPLIQDQFCFLICHTYLQTTAEIKYPCS